MNYKDQVTDVTLRGKQTAISNNDKLCDECCKWLREGCSVGIYYYTYLLHNFPVYWDENGDESCKFVYVCMDCFDPNATCYPRPEYDEE